MPLQPGVVSFCDELIEATRGDERGRVQIGSASHPGAPGTYAPQVAQHQLDGTPLGETDDGVLAVRLGSHAMVQRQGHQGTGQQAGVGCHPDVGGLPAAVEHLGAGAVWGGGACVGLGAWGRRHQAFRE